MLVGQQLGPFTIDKELGSGAMGTVYRGRYSKTGQVLAIKVMAPGLGSSNPTAVARFEREAAILKQLKHPNIVRLFGVGKSHGTRYYAMEYIEGESLDKVMSRRDRMSWEEVVHLGQQLCAALYHAHEAGIVHRDLKPSNLMMLPDGTLKLTDFGIAKDLDVTALTSANCTVGTASYMSPEQCKGERDISHKSDLYSLGCVFYELLTGRKPFLAETAMDMFLQHVQGRVERPSRLVPEIPVWLDTLVLHLMEKQPEQRPLNALVVSEVLGGIREKVEAQASVGAEAASTRRGAAVSRSRHMTEEDREAVRVLAGKKPRRKKSARQPFYTSIWFVGLGVVVLLSLFGFTLYLLLRPPSAEKLYTQASELMESDQREDHDRALEGPIMWYLKYHGGRPGEQTAQIRKWADQVRLEQTNDILVRYLKKERAGLGHAFARQSETQERAFDAAKAEDEGDLERALELWQELRKHEPYGPWSRIAQAHIYYLSNTAKLEKELLSVLDNQTLALGQEPTLALRVYQKGAHHTVLMAVRYENFGPQRTRPPEGDLARAYEFYEQLAQETDLNYQQLGYWLLAKKKLKELRENPKVSDRAEALKHRVNLINQTLAAVGRILMNPSGDHSRARAMCIEIRTLYGKDKDPEVARLLKLLDPLAVGLNNRGVPLPK